MQRRVFSSLLAAGVDPNELIRHAKHLGKSSHRRPYERSLIAYLLSGGPAAAALLCRLLDEPGLSGMIWSKDGRTKQTPEAFAAGLRAKWAAEPLAAWRRWRGIRSAWVSAVLRAP